MPRRTLIRAPYILTLEEEGVLYQHALLIEGEKITAIIPQEKSAALPADEILDLENSMIMPGLINLHTHAAMSLFRGYADDLSLMTWLQEHIWPLERQWLNKQFVYEGTLLSMAEMIKSGTTTLNDMYFYHSSVAQAGLKSGLRTFVGASILEFPTNYGENAEDYIAKAIIEKETFQGEPLITFTLAPHAPYSVSDETFKKIVALSDKENLLLHCHIHETADEIKNSMQQYGMRPIERLKQLGVINSRLIAAHMVYGTHEDIAAIHSSGMAIAHNPSSNLKLASGIAPIPMYLQNEISVGLGSDGAASNNRQDIWQEMHLAALLAKGQSLDPTALNALEALKMATLYGARALHINDIVGSLKVGKQADIIALSIDAIENQPIFDVVSHAVYVLGRENVTHVWVAGRPLLKNKQLLSLDTDNLRGIADNWQNRINQSGVKKG